MTLIKSHTCTKCGGALTVHNDRQQYECPYCSVFYDYEYFRSRDILEQAAASQKMLQYDSAIEKYEFILKKDPQNFTAIRGKLLCESKINRPEELRKAEKMMQISLDSLRQAEKAVEPDGKPYFSQLLRLRMMARSQMALHDSEKRKKFDRSFAGIYDHLKMTDPKRIAFQKNEEVLSEENQALVSMISSMSCTSCGGELIVNLNRQVYECPFCGLTFDFDIIRDETALSEVKDAIQKKQYLKADSIYEYILTVDSSNYEALRGRILCAAKCEDLQSIMATPEDCLQKAFIPAIKARIEEALASCKECDRPYFEEFNNAVPEFEAFASSSSPSNVHRRKKSSLVRKQNQLEKEYENAKKEYDYLQSKLPRKNHELAEGLTPKEMIRMHELSDKLCIIRNDINDLQPSIDESEEGISELDELGIYTIGNIRQHLANLIRLERVKNGEEDDVDLSGFHDAEWEEE